MIKTGKILKIEGRRALIFTEQCEMVCIEKQPGMYQSLEIRFSDSEIINKKNMFIQYSPLVGSIAAVFIFAFLLINSLYLSQSNIYAYVEVATNETNLELCIDKNNKIIDVKALDNSAEHLINNLDVISKSLENALSDILNKTDSLGLIKPDTEFPMLIATHIVEQGVSDNETDILVSICQKVVKNSVDKDIKLYIIEVNHDNRELAYTNEISMGRYSIYDKGIEQGLTFTIDYVKTAKIGDILKKIHIENVFEVNDNDDNQSITNTPTNNPSPTHDAAVTNTPNTSHEPTSHSPSVTSIPSSKPSHQPHSNTSYKTPNKPSQQPPLNTPNKTPNKPSHQPPLNTPNKTPNKPSQQPHSNTSNKTPNKPSHDDDNKLDTSLNVEYDLSIINATKKDIEKAKNQIDTIEQNIESNINQEKYNAETRIKEINNNSNLDWRKKQEKIHKINSDLNSKIADLRKNEKELISNVLENLFDKYDKMDDLPHKQH